MTTSGPTFFDRLRERVRATGGVLAVGLDPDPSRLPDDCREYDYPRRAFNRRIIDATHEDAAAYVANPAFYEDSDGWTALAETVAYAHGQGVPVVVDGKWTDVPSGGPRADLLDRADAATLSPFCGRDALEAALDHDCGAFVVCRTPNRGAADLQDRAVAAGKDEENDEENTTEEGDDEDEDEQETVAERVATLVGEWAVEANGTADVGLLVGGSSDDLESLRTAAPDLPFLVVGGATNDPEVAEFAVPAEGAFAPSADGQNEGIGLVEVSREVVYAGETAGRRGGRSGMDAYAAGARQSARRLKRQLNRHR